MSRRPSHPLAPDCDITPPPGGAQSWADWRREVTDHMKSTASALGFIRGGIAAILALLVLVGFVVGGAFENVAGKASAAEVQRHEGRFHK